jgi:hypothetical protein
MRIEFHPNFLSNMQSGGSSNDFSSENSGRRLLQQYRMGHYRNQRTSSLNWEEFAAQSLMVNAIEANFKALHRAQPSLSFIRQKKAGGAGSDKEKFFLQLVFRILYRLTQ